MQDGNEWVRVLLDTSPLACRLWNRDYRIFECNEEALRMFGLENKQELADRYYEFSPEYQPNGMLSREMKKQLLDKAFAEGRVVVEWLYQLSDGAQVPCEVTLVRAEHAGEYVVAGYTRDLREQKRMMADIVKHDKLLDVINRVASVLLAAANEDNFEETLLQGMELIGQCLEADFVSIWPNEMRGDTLHFALKYMWLSSAGKQSPPAKIGTGLPYSARLKELFLRGECINGPLSTLPQEDQDLLSPLGLTSTITIPIFYRDAFWGVFCVDDYIKERTFTQDEIGILHSAGLMLANAINRNEQSLQVRETHNRTRLLLNSAPLAIHLWDRDIKPFDCNEEAVRLFKMKDKQEYLERFADTAPEYQPDGLKSSDRRSVYVNKAFEDGKCVIYEWMHRASDGTLIPAEVTLVRVAYEDGYAVAAYVRDLRERKRMLEKVEQSSTLLATINKAANILLQSEVDAFESNLQLCMGMIGEAVNSDRMCIWKNSSKNGKLHCSQVCEWVSDDSLLTPAEIATDVSYEDNIPTWERFLSRGECVITLTRDLPSVERERMHMHGIKSVVATPVFVQGTFWGFVGCDNCHDETEFTDEVAAILQSGSLLVTHALLRNEMTLNLQTAATELESALQATQRANDAKSEFLASMSHEMRTPLNAIIGLSGLVLEDKGLSEGACSNLEQVYNSGVMLLSIVNDILDISKIEAGKMELVEVDYDVPSLINDTVAQNILRIGEKPITLQLDIGTDMFSRLHGDELRVKQIMNNLLSNAIKYTEEGVVKLGVHCQQEGERVWVTIKISDTGIGIRPEDMGNLFKDYATLDLKSNRGKEGTGLGLPIAKNLVQMMNGVIDVESEYGKGSVFTVRIAQRIVSDVRIGRAALKSLQNFRYSDDKRGRNAQIKRIHLPHVRVLVVDDNLTNLEVSKGLMKPYGMHIDCVTGGQQAIDAIRDDKVRYDAVFMDHMMPGIDGIEATRIIREEIGTEYAKTVPIIALTANAIAGNEAMFLSKGFQAFIPKPVEIERLDEVIRHWVRDGKPETTAEPAANPENHTPQSLFENVMIPTLNIHGGIRRFGGDEETYLDTLRSYAANTAPLLAQLQTVNEQTLTDYAIAVHGIKGSSRSICAGPTGDLAEDLEEAAKAGDFPFVTRYNDSLIELTRNLIHNIQHLVETIAAKNPKPQKDHPDMEALQKLYDASKILDTDEIDAQIKELDSYTYQSKGDLVAGLIQSAGQYKYKEIKQTLSALLNKEDNNE